MLLIFFGPSCSGKSTAADAIAERCQAEISTGKDYLRLAKNETEAWRAFVEKLCAAADSPAAKGSNIIYVVTNPTPEIPELASKPHVRRFGFTADIETLKERFAPRTGGKVPPPVVGMLERAKQSMDTIDCDARLDTTAKSSSEIVEEIVSLTGL
ncbi:hypothetical protein KQI84_10545 [bacterium]|nr:hypothetical protein [bacterium]